MKTQDCALIHIVFERLQNRVDILRLNAAADAWWDADQARIADVMNSLIAESPKGMYGQALMTDKVLEEIGRQIVRLAAEHCGAAKVKTCHAGWLELKIPKDMPFKTLNRDKNLLE